jgi:glycogen synthase
MPWFRIDFCGEGSDLESLRMAVSDRHLDDRCFVHGVCNADRVRTFYGDSHIVVVPTRSDFEEGYNKVCAEAVMAGRPVVTSAACPALDDVRQAALEVRVDDIASYVDAIVQLATDELLYRAKAAATRAVSELYFDSQSSYAVRLKTTLSRLAIAS